MADRKGNKSLEISIAVIGAILTALIGYGQWNLGQKQLEFQKEVDKQNQADKSQTIAAQKKASIDLLEMQALNIVGPYLGDLGVGGEQGKKAERVVSETADYLTTKYKRTTLAEIAKNLTDKATSVSEETRSRISEATEPAIQTEVWFTVLASLREDQLNDAKRVANEKLAEIKASNESLPVEIWKTKISKNYAIVVGGEVNRSRAVELSRLARSEHWADDAFPQVDKSWEKIGVAPFK